MRKIRFAMGMVGMAMSPVVALAAPADLCPGGQVATVRVSKIKPTGSMDGFKAAQAAQTAWYVSHSYKTTQFIAPVLDYDAKTDTESVSTNRAMTVRTGDDVPRDKHDAGWADFVAKYRANSDIESENRVCLPAR